MQIYKNHEYIQINAEYGQYLTNKSATEDRLRVIVKSVNIPLEDSTNDWVDTLALYEEINEVESGGNAGTYEDPIPYNNMMELFNGKYYSQNGIIYKCTRDSGIAMSHNLSELVGLYVEVATN